jgi:hypothetical protein
MTNNIEIAAVLPVVNDLLELERIACAVKMLVIAGMKLTDALTHVAPMPQPKIGDILSASWGYDQTNVDFYQVVAVTAASVKIRAILSRVVEATDHAVQVVAIPDAFDDAKSARRGSKDAKPLTKRAKIAADKSGYSVKISDYATADLWDGKPEFQTGGAAGH